MGKKFRKYAKVAVNAPIFDILTYGIPDEYVDIISANWRVMVTLRRRLVTGFVIDIVSEPDVDEKLIKPISDVPDEEPILTSNLMKLCKFVSNYYIAPLGETIAGALPIGIGIGTKQIVFLVEKPEFMEDYSKIQRKILSLLSQGPMPMKSIIQKIGNRGAMYHIRKLEQFGFVGRKYEYRIQSPPKTVDVVHIADDVTPELIDQMESKAPNQAGILRYLNQNGPTIATQIRKIFGASAVGSLRQKKYIYFDVQEILRGSAGWLTSRKNIEKLTDSQKKAIEQITNSLKNGDNKPILIHGITGSGKTLVYLETAKAVRKLGKGVLVLVPEVALTPQMWGVLHNYFGEDVAVLHSYLSPGERADAWRKLRQGKVQIALGARSAVFAPVKNLGLIIVDEEHDGSYKQGRAPFYNARDVAIVRAKYENALVILGSATPAVETYFNAVDGKYHLIEMPERVPGAKLPDVELLDLKTLRYNERIFSPQAKNAILRGIERGEQSILLLNRRGFSTSLICPDCGYVPQCPNCDVSLTYHRVGDDLRCHWCDYRTPAPDVCPNCGSENFKFRGKGTQKIEIQLYDFVEPVRVLRIDSDAIERKGALNKILEKFASKPGSVLVGTQMVAKGHDFPNVTLVVVIDADVGMAMPDFRAGEKTFQLLSQVAGRAGRGERHGLVIIQTRHPDEPAVQFAVNNTFKDFFAHALVRRQILDYPPFSRLIRIIAKSKDSQFAENSLRVILRELLKEKLQGITPLSPTKPPLAKLKGEYRWHILVKAKDIRVILPFLRRVARAKFKNVKIRIDIDPYDMM